MACFAVLMSLAVSEARAQQGFGEFGNFDPAAIQKRIMDSYREQLEISDDAEWKVIEPRVQKVMEAQREAGFGGSIGGIMRAFGRGQQGGQRGGRSNFLGSGPGPEEQALQKAIDAKASSAELKAALEKVAAARKQKQANLEKAQTELRQLLSVRQEANATLAGLL